MGNKNIENVLPEHCEIHDKKNWGVLKDKRRSNLILEVTGECMATIERKKEKNEKG